MWRKLLKEARAAGAMRSDVNLSAVRMSILGALNWSADWYRPTGDSPASLARDITTVFLHGLAAPAARGRREKT
jgi:hypothetical protein